MTRSTQRSGVRPAPLLVRSVRAATSDLYYNSWRFVAANALVGALLIAILLAAVATPLALVLLVVVAVPAAGMMRMATALVRDGHTDFGELWAVARRPWTVLALAAAQLAATAVLTGDIALGVAWGTPLGTFLAVSAIYGLVLGWAMAVVAWPLLMDPTRDAEPRLRVLRTAAVVLLAHPLRVGGFALVMAIVVALSTLTVMPVLTIALGWAWLVIAHHVLPLADRVERREPIDGDGTDAPRG